MKASRLYQNLHPPTPKEAFFVRKSSALIIESVVSRLLFVVVFWDFLQKAVQGTTVYQNDVIDSSLVSLLQLTDCQKTLRSAGLRGGLVMHYKDKCLQTHRKHVIGAGAGMIMVRNKHWTQEAERREILKIVLMMLVIKASQRQVCLLVSPVVDQTSWPCHELTQPQTPESRTVYLSQQHIRHTEKTGIPDLSTSISNTILIPSGSKEAASFACLSFGPNRGP